MTLASPRTLDRAARERAYFRYLIERGGLFRYGDPFWKTHERDERIEYELDTIETAGFSAAFIMLAGIMDFCRREKIPYGPGRGSVGGCYVAYLAGIHDVDSIEWGLDFERFLNPDRVSFPDVDLDFSQRDRDRVIQYIRDTYQRDGQIVLQIGAFVRAGARAVVDLMLAAMAQNDPYAGATATNLKKCLPEGNVTGGVKVARELAWWLENGTGDKARFKEIAQQAGWLDHMLKLDGMFTHLGKHAAGVVIMREEDLPLLPQTSTIDAKGKRSHVTAYDMYSLDDLKYLKWDILGLRTLDIVSDAHKLAGFSGEMPDLIEDWKRYRDDPDVYEILQDADTTGIFQMETPGYRRTLRDFHPTCFDHLVQLVALYRPGALDYQREDGKNMVEVFIDRRHGREIATYDHPALKPILEETHGIFLYQEQTMKAVRALAGFTGGQADSLRKAIGKKRPKEMAELMALFEKGCLERGMQPAVIERIKANITAAARYSWNKAHAVEYAIITWWTAWLRRRFPHAYFCALINSWEDKKDRQAMTIAEARKHAEFSPPDINVAEDRFLVRDGKIVFGFNGIKGMGDSYRNALLIERMLGGPFQSYQDFSTRVEGGVPSNIKRSLIACGAFDLLNEDRAYLLASIPKPGRDPEKRWQVFEHIEHNRKLKNPRPLPEDLLVYGFPSDTDLAKGEMDAMGYYISAVPLREITADLARMPASYIGGEVDKLRVHQDKNGNDMATVTLTTPALTHQRVRIFASNWVTLQHRVEKGAKLIFRGRMDGDTYLGDDCWEPGDYRHFKKLKVWRGDEAPTTETLNPDLGREARMSLVRQLEAEGCRVRFL